MKFNGILTLVVTVLIVVLISTAAIVPIVESAQKEQKHIENNTSERYMALSDDSTVVLSVVDSEPAINGEKLSTIFGTPTITTSFWVVSDNVSMLAVYNVSNTSWVIWRLHYWDSDDQIAKQVSMNSSGTITCSDGVIEYVAQDVSTTWSYTYLLVPSANGDYGAFYKNELNTIDCFVDDESTIYIRSIGNNGNYTMAHGTLSDIVIDLAVISYNKIDGASISCVYTPTEYNASNKLTNITALPNTVSMGSSAWVLVPIEYSVMTENDNMIYAMLGIIPVLLFVIPIMIIVRHFNVGRD